MAMMRSLRRDLASQADPFATWQVFGLAAVLSVLLTYYTANVVVTREYFEQLLSARLDQTQIESRYALWKEWQTVGIYFAPAILAFKALFTALLIQLALIILGSEVGFRLVFRAVLYAAPVMLAQSLSRQLWSAAHVAEDALTSVAQYVPLSSSFLVRPDPNGSAALLQVLNALSVGEAIWMAVVTFYLVQQGPLGLRRAALAVFAVWLLIEGVAASAVAILIP
ncbi:MAG TPA: hypothetical protein DGD08_18340 [Gemmatimonas aurantiaca]|uniref:Yip1 domain-containing protein n=3 Tax=Gemmatimonas aurantiaca TaxID=173480 RepID=A0A3D4VEC5_9BACT|nr:hypothetical membrane protein [Gemmatimonas aurantiaca T-27]HCT59164.1 hypothetical protein [Gemmatimonas aurantiaca]